MRLTWKLYGVGGRRIRRRAKDEAVSSTSSYNGRFPLARNCASSDAAPARFVHIRRRALPTNASLKVQIFGGAGIYSLLVSESEGEMLHLVSGLNERVKLLTLRRHIY